MMLSLRLYDRFRLASLAIWFTSPIYVVVIDHRDSAGVGEMAGRRHSAEEIAAKLAQAKDLAARGKTHRDIAKALGVSVMTFHRWRKTREEPNLSAPARANKVPAQIPDGFASEAAASAMELENLRLRRLVTDLLLEKLRLEDEIRGRHQERFLKGR
jgi:transposase-like protein